MTSKLQKIAKLYLIFPIIITVIIAGIMIPADSFVSTTDIFSFMGIMQIVEYAIMLFFYKVDMNVYKARIKWGDEQLIISETNTELKNQH